MRGKINAGGKEQLLFQRPGKVALLGFGFDEGQEITAFGVDHLAFEELLGRSPTLLYDMAVEICPAPNLGFFASEKWGKKGEYLVIHHGQERTFRSLKRMIEWAESIGIHKVSMGFSLPQQTSV